MLNHTYTSVKNANLVDCGKKQHIPSQPIPLLRDKFLGEYRTELDKKKVLANLGIATDLSLEWEYIKGDIGRSEALMAELDSRTKYISKIDGFQKSIIEGINYLETVVGGEEEGEEEQNNRLSSLEIASQELSTSLNSLKTYISETVDVNIETLTENLNQVTEKVDNITELIQVSTKAKNALQLIQEGEEGGLYVPDLSEEVTTAVQNIELLRTDVDTISANYVTKEDLGGGSFDFVDLSDFDNYVTLTNNLFTQVNQELAKTVKTGEDGHVDTLYVNQISKNNDEGNILITDSFEVTSGVPLDVRFVVESLDQLYSLKPLVCYSGMGVIVSSQASLYILREPITGNIDEEYIKDPNSWKCPEDLVIEVLTQEEYDKKVEEGNVNPNMFYYIHEEIVEEPIRENYDSDEAYTEALNKWLRVLQQKYMSAVWGLEIEELVANKASNIAVKNLETQIQDLRTLIDSLSGGSSEVNLKTLNEQVIQNTSAIETLIKEDETIQKEVSDLSNNLTNNYVTIESISTEDTNTEYIFLKKSTFETYTAEHESAIAEQITTKQLTIGEDSLTTSESNLLFNDEKIALDKQVPVIEVLSEEEYNALEEVNEGTYYYVYELENRYVLNTEFETYLTSQSTKLTTLNDDIVKNRNSIGELTNLTTESKNTIVFAINEVNSNLLNLTNNVGDLTQLSNSTIIQAITDINSKLSLLSSEISALSERVNSLETV